MCFAAQLFDVVLCDVPFGNHQEYMPPHAHAHLPPPHADAHERDGGDLMVVQGAAHEEGLRDLYWRTFAELRRVLREPNGRAVILTDQVRTHAHK